MNFNALELDVFRRLNYADSPASAVKTRIDAFLNDRHRRILAMPGLSQLRDDNITFATVSSQQYYAMGPAVARIKTIYDGTTNQLKLQERTLQWVRTMDPRLTQSGVPEAWIPISIKQTQSQPAAACDLHVISSNAGDTTQTCYVEYVRTGGYRGSANHALNGTSDVAITSTGDVIEVDKFYLTATCAGTITLKDASGGNTLATIEIGQTYGRYLWFQLWPTPSSVWTFNVDYTRNIADMAQATDEPLLPQDYHYLVALGARIDELEKLDDNRRIPLLQDWKDGISALKNWVLNNPDFIVVPGGTSRVRINNLGSWYPAGTWF